MHRTSRKLSRRVARQIDNHMRFVPGWDEKLIGLIKQCPTAPAVLSTWAPNYEPPNKLGRDFVRVMRPQEFDERGILFLASLIRDRGPASLNLFCCSHFLFDPPDIVSQ